MSRRHCDILVLSPHLDDAVLSCSLRMLRELEVGRSVRVATLFSGAWPKVFGLDFYCGRRAEDKAALGVLGVGDPIWLGFSDAIFRSPAYWRFSSIVLGENSSQLIDKVAARVCSLYDELEPSTVLLPLAVGTHIDHRCTFAMWNKLPPNANIVFYEDRPYSFLPKSVPIRLQAIGAKTDINQENWLSDRDNLMMDLACGLSKVTMYKNVLKNEHERLQYVRCLTQSIDKADGKQGQGAEKPFMNLKSETLATQSTTELEQIVKAHAAYVSQIGMLYDNMKVLRDEGVLYSQILDPSALYAERYWKLIR